MSMLQFIVEIHNIIIAYSQSTVGGYSMVYYATNPTWKGIYSIIIFFVVIYLLCIVKIIRKIQPKPPTNYFSVNFAKKKLPQLPQPIPGSPPNGTPVQASDKNATAKRSTVNGAAREEGPAAGPSSGSSNFELRGVFAEMFPEKKEDRIQNG